MSFTDAHVLAALAYARAVVSGEVPACRFVRQACQRQLDDLELYGGPSTPFEFSEAHAGRVCRFLELLHHVKGPKANARERIKLEPWQCFILTTVFGWRRRDTGGRRFRRVYLELPRGQGKSLLSSGVALYALTSDGEEGAEVYAAATTKQQALIVWDVAKRMLKRSGDFTRKLGVKIGKGVMTQARSNSVFAAMTRDASTNEGQNVHLAIVDELHAHPTRDIYDVVETAASKRPSSMVWTITTAGDDTAGICYELRSYVVAVLEGEVSDPSQFGLIYSVDTEAHTEVVRDPAVALAVLENTCDCCIRDRSVTPRGSTQGAGSAGSVTSDGGTSSRAESTPDARASPSVGALSARPHGLPVERPSSERAATPTSSNGDGPIGSATTRPTHDGGSATLERRDSRLSASHEQTTSGCIEPNAGGAPSATDSRKSSVSTTTTQPGSFEASSVGSAIQGSVTWEILRSEYARHSTTCAVRTRVSVLPHELRRSHSSTTVDAMLTDPSVWKMANPNWGISVDPENFAALAAKALEVPAARSNFLRKHLNVWTQGDETWIDLAAWDRCERPELTRDDFTGVRADLGIDLATKQDLACKATLFSRWEPKKQEGQGGELERHYYLFVDCYLPANAAVASRNAQYSGWVSQGFIRTTPGDVLDFDSIKNDVRGDASRYRIHQVGFDPWQATQMSQELLAEGIPMVEVRPTTANFSEPMKEFSALVLQGRIHHDGNPIVRWCLANTVCSRDQRENLYPRKERYELRIDAVVAALIALNRAMTHEPPVEESKSPYETRGIRVL